LIIPKLRTMQEKHTKMKTKKRESLLIYKFEHVRGSEVNNETIFTSTLSVVFMHKKK
jgi:hypothetical protein